MNSKREKLQYIYVFFADASALAVSVLLVWLVLDRVFHRITAYSMSDWLLALSALATAFLAAFLCFDQSENIVGRSLEKEIRLSLNIDTNDFNTKVNQAAKFLQQGHKIKVSIRFRGREMAHTNLGVEVHKRFAEALAGQAVIDKQPKLEGRSMMMFLSPAANKSAPNK